MDVLLLTLTGRVAVVKGNAYGHGAVPVARYLMATGVADRLAVATMDEAVQLRLAGIDGVIHVLGGYCIQSTGKK